MLPSSVRILLCTVPQDMRRSFDTLALTIKQLLGEDPQSGTLYVFVGKRPTRVKVLWWDRNGYCLLYKRLHRSLIRMPAEAKDSFPSVRIDANGLAQLLSDLPPKKWTNDYRANLVSFTNQLSKSAGLI